MSINMDTGWYLSTYLSATSRGCEIFEGRKGGLIHYLSIVPDLDLTGSRGLTNLWKEQRRKMLVCEGLSQCFLLITLVREQD